ncbi:MAG: hypothetical protein ACQEV0_08460 [Bacillota bacterium]
MAEWIPLFTLVGTLGGVWLGGFLANRGQSKVLQMQISWEKEKTYKSQHDSRLKAYSKVLEIDGKDVFISEPHGLVLEFDFIGYQEKVRPILYNEFHFLHEDVTNVIRGIDQIIQQISFDENMSQEQEDSVCEKYLSLIELIEQHLKDNSEIVTNLEKNNL